MLDKEQLKKQLEELSSENLEKNLIALNLRNSMRILSLVPPNTFSRNGDYLAYIKAMSRTVINLSISYYTISSAKVYEMISSICLASFISGISLQVADEAELMAKISPSKSDIAKIAAEITYRTSEIANSTVDKSSEIADISYRAADIVDRSIDIKYCIEEDIKNAQNNIDVILQPLWYNKKNISDNLIEGIKNTSPRLMYFANFYERRIKGINWTDEDKKLFDAYNSCDNPGNETDDVLKHIDKIMNSK